MNNKELPKAYDSKQVEDDIYQAWESSGFFDPDKLPGNRAEMFSLMMPPPNVTGVLHLGHALENSLMDTMIRYQRMRGKRALLLPGTDHAAVATQARVEKNLIESGEYKNPREELGREKLLEIIREYAEKSKATILSQIKKMGTSCDWSRLAYTFDDDRSKAVNELFIRMYNDGLVYRGYRVINWSVKGQSTCSDDELVYKERAAKLYTFRYSKDFPIPISSTRPETKLGDTAVAIHPEDDRYKQYIGKTFTVDIGAAQPFMIKVITDTSVDPAFGTGALGVTPAHSPLDYEMYERRKGTSDEIGLIPVIDPHGNMTANAGAVYAGFSAETAREKFVTWLRAQGLIEKEEDIQQNVGTSDRFGDVVEAIPMEQWFVAVNKEIPGRGKTLKDLMRDAVTTGHRNDPTQKISITPERFEKIYLQWIDNLRDWCISRQIWWGHRIPVWYKREIPNSQFPISDNAEMYIGATSPESEGWTQDSDTLDTWFSSGAWTFSTLGWPDQTKDLKTFHPTTWMQMGYEILFFWMARMILMSTYALDEIPFKNVYIHGILRDAQGRKFSKSLGNGVDPLEIIEKYGTDALRLAVMIGITPGNDSRFYIEKVEHYRNFINKLWNVSRYILTNVGTGRDHARMTPDVNLQPKTLADRWIISRFNQLIAETTEHFENYRFSQAAENLYSFTWHEFADWYLEIAKIQIKDEKLKNSTSSILINLLTGLLTLWHPFIPFVTEYIYQQTTADLLMIEKWPEPDHSFIDKESTARFEKLKTLITAIRTFRSEHAIDAKQVLNVSMSSSHYLPPERGVGFRRASSGRPGTKQEGGRAHDEQLTLGDFAHALISKLARVRIVQSLSTKPRLHEAGVDIAIEIPHDPALDAKRAKERTALEKYITNLERKLSDTTFTSKAPPAVVEKERAKLEEAKLKLSKLA